MGKQKTDSKPEPQAIPEAPQPSAEDLAAQRRAEKEADKRRAEEAKAQALTAAREAMEEARDRRDMLIKKHAHLKDDLRQLKNVARTSRPRGSMDGAVMVKQKECNETAHARTLAERDVERTEKEFARLAG